MVCNSHPTAKWGDSFEQEKRALLNYICLHCVLFKKGYEGAKEYDVFIPLLIETVES